MWQERFELNGAIGQLSVYYYGVDHIIKGQFYNQNKHFLKNMKISKTTCKHHCSLISKKKTWPIKLLEWNYSTNKKIVIALY